MATIIPSSNKLAYQTQAIMEAMGNLGQGIGRLIERKREAADFSAVQDWFAQQSGGQQGAALPDVQINAGNPMMNAAAGLPLPMNIPRPAQGQTLGSMVNLSTLPKFSSRAGQQFGMNLVSKMAQDNMLSPMDMQQIRESQAKTDYYKAQATAKESTGFTLREGETKFDAQGKPVVSMPAKTPSISSDNTLRGMVDKLNYSFTVDGIPLQRQRGDVAQEEIDSMEDVANKIGKTIKEVPTSKPGYSRFVAVQIGPTGKKTDTAKIKSPSVIKTDADYESLASGTEFIAPDGTRRRKP